jgi:hypothetical protein
VAEEYSPIVLLETINPLDITPEELEVLADELRSQLPGLDIQLGYDEQHGAGVTWHEVLRIWLPDAQFLTETVFTTLFGVVVENMRQRFKRRHSGRRPRSIVFHDSRTAEEIAVYVLEGEEGEPRSDRPRPGRRERPEHHWPPFKAESYAEDFLAAGRDWTRCTVRGPRRPSASALTRETAGFDSLRSRRSAGRTLREEMRERLSESAADRVERTGVPLEGGCHEGVPTGAGYQVALGAEHLPTDRD